MKYHFVVIYKKRKGQRSNFSLYRGQIGKLAPILLKIVSRCLSFDGK